jgi:hypothetical protein
MVTARAGEEIVCPRGTLCGQMIRDVNDEVFLDDFMLLKNTSSSDSREYVCACCMRIVVARDDRRWRVDLRRGWLQ